jgi:hypothetical protein
MEDRRFLCRNLAIFHLSWQDAFAYEYEKFLISVFFINNDNEKRGNSLYYGGKEQ